MRTDQVETIYPTHTAIEVIDLDKGVTVMRMTVDKDGQLHSLGNIPSVVTFTSGNKPRRLSEEYHSHGRLLRRDVFDSGGKLIR